MLNVFLEIKDSVPYWKFLLLGPLEIRNLNRVVKIWILEVISEEPCLESKQGLCCVLPHQLRSSTSEKHLR